VADDRLNAAVAAAALASEETDSELLRSIVEAARSLFAARAASIMLLDEEADELVFEAVAGEGSGDLVGTRFPASQGITGWVASAGQPLAIDDVSQDPRFSRETAERTGYVPKSMMSVPLLREDRSLGVLSVLDRADEGAFGLDEIELLELFANQASIAVDIVQRTRTARQALAGSGELAVVARLAAALDALEGPQREAGLQVLEAMARVLGASGP
jgi:GAF domain-containing protein